MRLILSLSGLFFGFSLFVSGCSNGSKNSETQINNSTYVGVFLDSAVEGLKYKTSSGLEGYTNTKGEYNFNAGDSVEFFVGDISLGKVSAQLLLITDDLPFPTQTAQFLQTLDADGIVDNGIQIKREIYDEPLFKKATIKGNDQSVFAQNLDIKDFDASEKNNNFIREVTANIDIENRNVVPALVANTHKAKSKALSEIANSNQELYSYIKGDAKINNLPSSSNLHERLSSRLLYYYYSHAFKREIEAKKIIAEKTYNNIELTYKERDDFAKSWFNIAGITTELGVYATDLVIDNNLSKTTKARIIQAGQSSGKSEIYQYVFADHDVLKEMFSTVESCVKLPEYPLPSVDGVIGNITGKAGMYYNCIVGESFKALNKFNFIYSDSVGLQEYQYIAIAKNYLDQYYKCGEYNNVCMSESLGGNETVSDQLGYIMEKYGLNIGLDSSIKVGTNIVINDYKERIATLANDLKNILPSSVYFDYKYTDKEAVGGRLNMEVDPLKIEDKDEGIFWINLDLKNRFDRNLRIKSFTAKFLVNNNEFIIASDYYGVLADKLYSKDIKSIDPLKNIRIPISLNNHTIPRQGIMKFILTIDSETTDKAVKDTVQKVLTLDLESLWSSTKIDELDAQSISLSQSIGTAEENTKFYLPNVFLGTTKVVDLNNIYWQFNPMSYKYSELKLEKDSKGYYINIPKLSNVYTAYISLSAFVNSSEASNASVFVLNIDKKKIFVDTIPPTFTTGIAVTADVYENKTTAITLSATDTNSSVTYSISGDDAALFNVDAQSGVVTFKVAPNYEAVPIKTQFLFVATAKDSAGNEATQNVTINLLDVDETVPNNPPVAQAKSVTVTQDSTANAITLTGTDADGDTLSYTVVTQPINGTLSGTAPNLTYTPTAGYNGTDSFTFKVNDGTVDSAVVTVSITVTAVSTGTITHNGFTYGEVTSPYTGRVWLDRNLGASRVCTALDDTECYGDYYQWGRGADGHEKATSSTTTTLVTDINPTNSSFITNSNSPYDWTTADSDGSLRADNWSKTDGSSICPVGYRVPTESEVTSETLNASTSGMNLNEIYSGFLKVPSAGYRYALDGVITLKGNDVHMWIGEMSNLTLGKARALAISSNDGLIGDYGLSGAFSVRCIKEATPQNTPPTANDQNITVAQESTANAITLLGTDADGDTLSYTLVTQPSNGTLSGTAPNLTYTPTAGYSGTDSFTFKVNDGTVDSAVVTVNITVTATPTATNSTIKKTGQTKSYDVNGTEVTDGSLRDDGYYQTGATPNYTRASDMVTDELTGLMWQDDAAVATVTKPWITQANYDAGNYDDTSGDTATTYCSDLSLGGYTDWRLPTSTELEGIVDYGKYSPAIDTTYFNNFSSGYYWSSTTCEDGRGYAWIVDFGYGDVYYYSKDLNYYVRCVRAGQ